MKSLIMVGVALCAVASQGMPRRNSSGFDFKYEMEVLPSEQDLDQDGAYDFTKTVGGGATITPYCGMAVCDCRPGAGFLGSAEGSGEAGGVWARYGATAATGFTVEARISIRATTAKYALSLTASVPDSDSHAFLNFTTNRVMWGDTVLTNNIDLAYFHVWRIAKEAGGGYYVWCDGNLIGENLGSGAKWERMNRLIVGAIGGAYRSAAYVSYLRFTKGGYAPPKLGPSPLGRDSLVFEHKYEMNNDDTRFSPTATTSDWTLSKSDGTASMADGVLSVSVPQGKLHFWQSGPLDPSVAASSPFTFEIKARVRTAWGSDDNVLYLSVGTPRESSIFFIGTNSVTWQVRQSNAQGPYDIKTRIQEGDNSDGMHVFRLTCTGDGDQAGGAGGFALWRDGEKIAEDLRPFSADGGSYVIFGVGSRTTGGSFDVDYLRWTIDGDFTPYVAPPGMALILQ